MKQFGYCVSIVSVFLLAVPSLKNATQDRTLLLCIVGGVLLSILGMAMRWLAYRKEQRAKQSGH